MHTANENEGRVSVMVYRSGDISYRSTVRCYTRQGSAQVMMDFEERPNTDASLITFLPGRTLIMLRTKIKGRLSPNMAKF